MVGMALSYGRIIGFRFEGVSQAASQATQPPLAMKKSYDDG
jgi:hypothetical protein